MVKQVMRWATEDGMIFETEDKAIYYENVKKYTELIRSELSCATYLSDITEVVFFIEKYTKGWK